MVLLRNVLFARIILLTAMPLIFMSSSCQSSGIPDPVPPAIEQPRFELPLPSELSRNLSYSDADRFKLGSEFDPVLPTNLVGESGNYLTFMPYYDPDEHPLYNGMAYAMYRFDVDGYSEAPILAYHWYAHNMYEDSLWLGLADFENNRWDWFRCNSTEQLALSSIDPYLHDDGYVIVTTLAFDPTQGTSGFKYSALQFLRLGPRVGSWVLDTVDTECYLGDLSLAVDEYYIPHIAYTDWGFDTSAIMYATRRAEWSVVTVRDEDEQYLFPSIFLEDTEDGQLPRISYRNHSQDDLRLKLSALHTTMYGELMVEWPEEVMVIDLPNPVSSRMVPHNSSYAVAFIDQLTGTLNYASFNGVDWINAQVADDADMGNFIWLAINPSGRPAISYRNISTGNLMLAEHTGLDWQTSIIEAAGGDAIGLVSCLRYGPDNLPQVCFTDATHEMTIWAKYDGADWQVDPVFDLDPHGIFNSMVVDSNGVPHIVVQDTDHKHLKHFWRDPESGSWPGETVDFGSGLSTGNLVAIEIDDRDRLYIAYNDDIPGPPYTLKFAYQVD